MISKILMSCCYKEQFLAGDNKDIKSKIHFHSMCQRKHSHYVLFCKEHPFGKDFVSRTDYQNQIEKRLDCKSGLSHEVCDFCFSVRYLLNFKCFKICMGELPDTFIERIVPLDHYFKKMNCDPFFFLSKKTKNIEVSLDNLKGGSIIAESDYRYGEL